MKLEFKYLKKVDEEIWFIWYFVLSLLVILSYGIWIGVLLDSTNWQIFLTVGVFFIIVLLSEPLAKIKIRRLK